MGVPWLCSGKSEGESLSSWAITDVLLCSRGVGAREARGWVVLASSVAKERSVSSTAREGHGDEGEGKVAGAISGLHYNTSQKVLIIIEGLEGNET